MPGKKEEKKAPIHITGGKKELSDFISKNMFTERDLPVDIDLPSHTFYAVDHIGTVGYSCPEKPDEIYLGDGIVRTDLGKVDNHHMTKLEFKCANCGYTANP